MTATTFGWVDRLGYLWCAECSPFPPHPMGEDGYPVEIVDLRSQVEFGAKCDGCGKAMKPYPPMEQRRWFTRCPMCGVRFEEERKDDESFKNDNYAAHVLAVHPETVIEFGPGLQMVPATTLEFEEA